MPVLCVPDDAVAKRFIDNFTTNSPCEAALVTDTLRRRPAISWWGTYQGLWW